MTNCKNTLAIALALALIGCGGGSPHQPGGNAAATAADAPIAIGTLGKAGGVDLTVTAVAARSQIGPTGIGPKADAGEVFVVASYAIKNTGTKPLGMMEIPGLSLIDGSGQSYAQDDMASGLAAISDGGGISADLNPGVTVRTKAAWKVQRAGFDKATWRLVAGTDPRLTFALK